MKSGTLNLLEPLGPVQACNGIALPVYNCGRMREKEVPIKFWWRNLRKRGHLEDLGVGGRII